SDAGVATWHSKYVYNVERPVSYIRRILPAEYPEAKDFSSILNNPPAGYSGVTPAFPAYPSGHSGFGGAGGKILSSIFEFNSIHPGTFSFTDNCHKDRTDFIGSPRSFSSFRDMADEDAFSRIPLGVHFRMDCSEGVRLGELAAQRVLELPWKK
ncbi:MAG TPA: phosphatase PAP2 family protein, partial [Saprospiraceae bacterium]|nr:phosphatase PAP2 family protein [Saprospiraceae bacterium]